MTAFLICFVLGSGRSTQPEGSLTAIALIFSLTSPLLLIVLPSVGLIKPALMFQCPRCCIVHCFPLLLLYRRGKTRQPPLSLTTSIIISWPFSKTGCSFTAMGNENSFFSFSPRGQSHTHVSLSDRHWVTGMGVDLLVPVEAVLEYSDVLVEGRISSVESFRSKLSVIVLKVFLQRMVDSRVASSCHCPCVILQAWPYLSAKALICAAVHQDGPHCTRSLRKLASE